MVVVRGLHAQSAHSGIVLPLVLAAVLVLRRVAAAWRK